MRCPDVPALLLERELGGLAPETARELAAHLASCAPCARVEHADRMLSLCLDEQRRTRAADVDVVARVMHAVRPLPLPAPRESRLWARSSAAAAAAAFMLAPALFAQAAAALPSRQALTNGFGAASAVAGGLARTATSLVEAGASALSGLSALALPLAQLAAWIEPVVLGTFLGGAVMMALTIAIVLARDCRPLAQAERGAP